MTAPIHTEATPTTPRVAPVPSPATSKIRSGDHDLILTGLDSAGKPHAYTHGERLTAVWAWAHDRAVELHGAEKMPGFFTSAPGNKLMAALEGTPDGASVDEMKALVEKHLGGKS